jgi:hypothetical protein
MRESLRESADLHRTRHTLDRIESRCLSLDIGIGREDDLRDIGRLEDLLKEGCVVELIGSDSLYR